MRFSLSVVQAVQPTLQGGVSVLSSVRCTFFKVAVFSTANEVVPRRVYKPSSSRNRVYLFKETEAFFNAKPLSCTDQPRVAETLRSGAV